MKLLITTFFALLAFAANSLLARMALAEQAIDAASFTTLRVAFGALFLFAFCLLKQKTNPIRRLNHYSAISGASLLAYALLFSFAYLELSTGTGALLLFGSVQISLVLAHCLGGNGLSKGQSIGIIIATLGFVVLMLPSAQQPDVIAAIYMLSSGVAWAIFTVIGKKLAGQGISPTQSVTQGFIVATGLSLFVMPLSLENLHVTVKGVLYALLSGSLASGAGYVLWYQALSKLSLLQASVSQLTVPVIALGLGILILGESLSLDALLASSLILVGVGLVVTAQSIQSNK
ncbi:DMT family transporter [Vibrio sp. WXL103]|uniref:DMT family transporter n=1 Tax=unclassified Vibrio TaxID=2614977 RepID=UPI003EC7E848